MSRVGDRDTKPELMLRKALWHRGHRYRLHTALPGKPDLVFKGARIAVFVDGCFWHGCPAHGSVPKTNRSFWAPKLERNCERDREVTDALTERGWTVLRFWEHQIAERLERVVSIIESELRKTD